MVVAIALTSVIIVLVVIIVLLLMANRNAKDSLREEQNAKGLLIEILSEHGEGRCVQTPKLK